MRFIWELSDEQGPGGFIRRPSTRLELMEYFAWVLDEEQYDEPVSFRFEPGSAEAFGGRRFEGVYIYAVNEAGDIEDQDFYTTEFLREAAAKPEADGARPRPVSVFAKTAAEEVGGYGRGERVTAHGQIEAGDLLVAEELWGAALNLIRVTSLELGARAFHYVYVAWDPGMYVTPGCEEDEHPMWEHNYQHGPVRLYRAVKSEQEVTHAESA